MHHLGCKKLCKSWDKLPTSNWLPSLKPTWPLKMNGWKKKYPFGARPIFRGKLLASGRVARFKNESHFCKRWNNNSMKTWDHMAQTTDDAGHKKNTGFGVHHLGAQEHGFLEVGCIQYIHIAQVWPPDPPLSPEKCKNPWWWLACWEGAHSQQIFSKVWKNNPFWCENIMGI